MSAIKMDSLPGKAGSAVLNFGSEWRMPQRLGNEIRLPLEEGMEFFSLMNGQQFLVIYPRRLGGRIRREIGCFFGGMDESPFITALSSLPLQAFISGGESSFYETLRPDAIKQLEREIQDGKVKRQGDIWSFSLPTVGWHQLANQAFPNSKRYRRRRRQLLGIPSGSSNVMDTNHRLHGKCFTRGRTGEVTVGRLKLQGITLVEGTLTAPDHVPIELEGPHVLTRTPYIVASNEWDNLNWE